MIQRNDGGGDGHTSYFDAPARYLGDKSAFLGGYLEFEEKLNNSGNVSKLLWLRGAGLELVYSLPAPSPYWTAYRAFLTAAAGWQINTASNSPATDAQLRQVLGNLEFLRIKAEFVTGGEVISLDNVRLVGPPPSLSVRRLNVGSWVVEWPAAAECFQLEASASLDAPRWEPVSATPERVGSVLRVPLTPTTASQFFRLRRAE